MRRRVNKRFLPSHNPLQNNVVANAAQATVPTPVKLSEKVELEQVNVLYSFLENRYSNKVRLTKFLRSTSIVVSLTSLTLPVSALRRFHEACIESSVL